MKVTYISETSIARLNGTVSRHIELGWELYGNLVVSDTSDGTLWVQCMIKK